MFVRLLAPEDRVELTVLLSPYEVSAPEVVLNVPLFESTRAARLEVCAVWVKLLVVVSAPDAPDTVSVPPTAVLPVASVIVNLLDTPHVVPSSSAQPLPLVFVPVNLAVVLFVPLTFVVLSTPVEHVTVPLLATETMAFGLVQVPLTRDWMMALS